MNKHTWAVMGIVGIGLLVRLVNINGSFWLDEAAQALESARPLSEQLVIANDFQPPLYHLLVHFFLYGGMSEWWLRLASLIPGLLSIWLTIRIGKKLFSEHVGMLSGLFLATSQFHAFYSQELRPYSLAALWALVMVDAYLEGIHKRAAWVQFTMAGIAGIYTTYVFPVLLLVFLGQKKTLKQVAVAYAVMAVAFVPWLPSFLEQLQIGSSLSAESAVWSSMVSPPILKMVPLTVAKFLLGRVPLDLNVQTVVIALVAGMILFYAGIHNWRRKKFLLLWFLVPMAAAFLISLKVPVLDPKRVLFCLPALYLIIASGLGKGIQSLIATFLLLSINLQGITLYATDPDLQREPWREAVAQIEKAASNDDLVVFAFPAPFAPWAWYQTKQLPTVAIGDPKTQVNERMWLALAAQRVNKVFVFDYLMDMTDPERMLMTSLEDNGVFETDFYQYPGIGKIRVFEIEKPVAYSERAL